MMIGVSQSVLDDMIAHAARAGLEECCGLLLGENIEGEGEQITQAVAAANIHETPQTHFEIDPQALVDAHRAARNGGLQVIGYYHSHPSGPAHPSATDQRMTSGDGRIWAIITDGQVGMWRDQYRGFKRLRIRV